MRPITAGDLMNPEILTVEADMTVRELAAFLVENETTMRKIITMAGIKLVR